jgi:hypothetical protein
MSERLKIIDYTKKRAAARGIAERIGLVYIDQIPGYTDEQINRAPNVGPMFIQELRSLYNRYKSNILPEDIDHSPANGNAPAFPSQLHVKSDLSGLTKREYFAAMAIQGLVRDIWQDTATGEIHGAEYAASLAVRIADALIKELQ